MNLDKLEAALEQQLPNGAYVYEDEKVREILPALFLLSGQKLSEAKTKAMRDLLDEFRRKLELEADASEDQFASKLAAYYTANPPDRGLLQELRAAGE